MEFPSVFLAIDNCFASKRWTRPGEWMDLAQSLGLSYVEASADTEADPLYAGAEYLKDWVADVRACEERSGVRVANLYSGHGTYTTLGLAHPDARVRERMRELWIKPMVRTASEVKAGLGFFCHAFPESVLEEQEEYKRHVALLEEQLAEIASYSAGRGVGAVGVEQMYSPHQIPWTINGARLLLQRVYAKGRSPFYLTIDTGHQSGQHKFLRPDAERITRTASEGHAAGAEIWLGSRRATDCFDRCARNGGRVSGDDLAFLAADMDRHAYLFSSETDCDSYAWLESLGCMSPIIHLQQVTAGVSAHLPFTAQNNSRGTVHPTRLLRALLHSYRQPVDDSLPPPVSRIFLTLEIFSGTAETREEILRKLRESVDYWRSFIPRDGMRLDEIVALNG
jgi:D-erythrulose 1-phosphate 3-epimerase